MLRHVLAVAVLLLCTSLFAETEASFPLKYERIQESKFEKTGLPYKEIVTGHGTAFAITNDRLLTCAHNILSDDKHEPYEVMWVEVYGKRIVVRPVFYIRELDLAIIEPLKPLALKETLGFATENGFPGDTITISGSLKGTPVEDYVGKITALYHNGTINTRAAVTFNHGLSGSPVLNEANQVIGMATAGIPLNGDMDYTQGLFVPANVLRDFMRLYFAHEDGKYVSRKVVVLKKYADAPTSISVGSAGATGFTTAEGIELLPAAIPHPDDKKRLSGSGDKK